MTRDDIRLLRDANPVRHAIAYSEDEIGRRVADILDSDQGLLALAVRTAPRPGKARRRPVPALAAAVVLIVAAVSALLFSRGQGSRDAASPSTSPVTCAVSTDGGSQATRDREAQAEQVIKTRVRALGGRAEMFATDASNGTIGFAPRGVGPAAAAQACRMTTTAIRTLVTSPVPADKTSARSSDPLAALTFTVPESAAAYARLEPMRQTQLAVAMSHYDCSGEAAAGSVALRCSDPNGSTRVYLLASRLAGDADIRTATAQAPTANGSPEWTVELRLHAAAAARMKEYTARHHTSTSGRKADLSHCGSTASDPCQDFLAFTADDLVIFAPQTMDASSTDVAITGGLTRNSATDFAADFTAASIQLRPI